MRACRPKSSFIDRIVFDEEGGVLTVSISGRRRYAYFEVPRELYDQLCRAVSAGQFFNDRIKGRFACKDVGERRRFRPA